MSRKDPIEQNIAGVQSLIGSKINKIPYNGSDGVEGIQGELEDALTLKLSNDELLELANAWEAKYRPYEARISMRQEAQKQFYLGVQKENSGKVTDGLPISSNLIFEAEETFLPAALAKNPEPVVWSDNTPEGNKVSNEIKTMLQYHADVLSLRRKLTKMTRHWSIYFIGAIKHGWDNEIKDIKSEIIDPRTLIFDPDGFIDDYMDYEGPLGQKITVPAYKMVDLFPKSEALVTLIVDGKMGTDVTYTEWWNDDYCFYTFKGHVIEKNKNPHFNYTTTETQMDEYGIEAEVENVGKNHFAKPKKPFTFLSVFSLGEQPHDITGLIEQNIPNQRRITRRTDQIDQNLTKSNNSDIFSQNNFNQETAKQASDAIAAGRPVLVPQGGPISDAIHRLQANGMDGSFFNELENSKNDLRSIFGTQGITAQQQDEDQTARGMILNQQYDNSRIGGGIGDALEQVADNIFNWWVQLYYVYYDEPHFATVMGGMKAVEYVTLQSSDLGRRIVVSVSPNSMKPKDETTIMNQAMSLWDRGAIDPKTLLTILDFPDPQQTAEGAVLWGTDKVAYLRINFPELYAQMMGLQAQDAASMASLPPPGGAPPPEAQSEPAPPISMDPASAALSNVQLPA